MPLYEYQCEEHGQYEQFFKSLPSEAKQKSIPCPDCDKPGIRLLSSFLTGGTQSTSIETTMGRNALTIDVGGRPMPAFKDENGQLHEVRRSEDIERWKRSNQNGKPRMVEWHNPKTGEKSWVPQRVRMMADPISGEPMDAPTVKESVKMVELDHFDMPTETRTGIPIDPKTGTPKVTVAQMANAPIGPPGRRLIDPDTGKPMTLGGMWGSEPGGNSDKQYVKAVLQGSHKAQDKT